MCLDLSICTRLYGLGTRSSSEHLCFHTNGSPCHGLFSYDMHMTLGPKSWTHSIGHNLPSSVCKKADGLSEGEGQRALEQAVFTRGTVSPACVAEVCLLV